ncbi:hypothetical protein [Micromonospora maris]|uniref:hypothetical protein n=1 Tax=Micromonospora maris TaxID=1003110 RepID=UPI0011D2451D|nr:hypothetical protein [Micromonospora maris]
MNRAAPGDVMRGTHRQACADIERQMRRIGMDPVQQIGTRQNDLNDLYRITAERLHWITDRDRLRRITADPAKVSAITKAVSTWQKHNMQRAGEDEQIYEAGSTESRDYAYRQKHFETVYGPLRTALKTLKDKADEKGNERYYNKISSALDGLKLIDKGERELFKLRTSVMAPVQAELSERRRPNQGPDFEVSEGAVYADREPVEELQERLDDERPSMLRSFAQTDVLSAAAGLANCNDMADSTMAAANATLYDPMSQYGDPIYRVTYDRDHDGEDIAPEYAFPHTNVVVGPPEYPGSVQLDPWVMDPQMVNPAQSTIPEPHLYRRYGGAATGVDFRQEVRDDMPESSIDTPLTREQLRSLEVERDAREEHIRDQVGQGFVPVDHQTQMTWLADREDAADIVHIHTNSQAVYDSYHGPGQPLSPAGFLANLGNGYQVPQDHGMATNAYEAPASPTASEIEDVRARFQATRVSSIGSTTDWSSSSSSEADSVVNMSGPQFTQFQVQQQSSPRQPDVAAAARAVSGAASGSRPLAGSSRSGEQSQPGRQHPQRQARRRGH